MDVERLRLVDKRASSGSHVHQYTLLNFPHSLVNSLQVIRDVEVDDRAVVRDQTVLQRWIPQAHLGQIRQQVLVDDGEFTGQHTLHQCSMYTVPKHSLLPKIWEVDAVGIGATKRELRELVLGDGFSQRAPSVSISRPAFR